MVRLFSDTEQTVLRMLSLYHPVSCYMEPLKTSVFRGNSERAKF